MNKYLIAVVGLLAVVVLLICFVVPRYIASWVDRAIENGGQLTERTVECPKCHHVQWMEFGSEVHCSGCGNRLTICSACGKLLPDDRRFRISDESKWMCETHYRELLKRREYQASLDQPGAQILPERKGWTEKVQQFYETHFKEADAKHLEYRQLFPKEQTLNLHKDPAVRASVPPAVREAYDFYRDCMNDHEILDVYRVKVDGAETFAVRAVYDGGSDMWIEVYSADGAPQGFGRSDSGIVLWKSKGAIRKLIFEGKLEPEFQQARHDRKRH